MEFMGSGMMTVLSCGCCCLAVVILVGVVAVLGTRRRASASGGAGDTPAAPARGSSTNARLTYMDEPLANAGEAATVQLRPLPKSVPPAQGAGQSVNRSVPVPDGTVPRPAPQPQGGASGAATRPPSPAPAAPAASPPPLPQPPPANAPRVIPANPTFIPPADDDVP